MEIDHIVHFQLRTVLIITKYHESMQSVATLYCAHCVHLRSIGENTSTEFVPQKVGIGVQNTTTKTMKYRVCSNENKLNQISMHQVVYVQIIRYSVDIY